MEEIKDLQQAWKEDSDASDAFLARYYSGSGKDSEIAALNEEQTRRLLELYCGDPEAMEDTRWLKKAAGLGNPYAKKLYAEMENKETPQKPEQKQSAPKEKQPKKKKKKSGWVLVLALILMAAVLGGGYAYYRYTTDTVTIDPIPYISYQVSGRDGSGTASASIDAPKMSADSRRIVDGEVISLVISKNEGLSNGDVVTLEVVVNAENAERNHVAFSRTSMEFTVNGLEELEKVDVFDEIEVSFSGENGKGTARVVSTSNDPFLSRVTYVCEPSENLSIGDVIMVRAVITPEMEKEFGKTAEQEEKDATVVSLSRYPVTVEDFSDAAYGQLCDKAAESLRSAVFSDSVRYSEAADPGGKDSLSGMRAVNVWPKAVYVISPQTSSERSAQFRNRIILIMHVEASDSGAALREFYCPVIFQNVLINDEEVLSLEDQSVSSEVWLHGGKKLEEVYEDIVSGYRTNFTVMGKTIE